MGLMVLRVKLTQSRYPTNSPYTPMDNTPLHSLSNVCNPWSNRCREKKTFCMQRCDVLVSVASNRHARSCHTCLPKHFILASTHFNSTLYFLRNTGPIPKLKFINILLSNMDTHPRLPTLIWQVGRSRSSSPFNAIF